MENILLSSTRDTTNIFGSSSSQLANLSKRLSRRQRNQRYRTAVFGDKISEDVFNSKDCLHGLPQTYKVQFTDLNAKHDPSLDDLTIVFGRLGDAKGGIVLGDNKISPNEITLSASTKTYTFSTAFDLTVDGKKQNVPIAGLIDFESPVPAGHLEINHRLFRAKFVPASVSFNAEVSHNAGAYRSSGDDELKWDPASAEWKGATWEPSLGFAYGVVVEDDPIMPRKYIENFFHDRASDPETVMKLQKNVGYTCVMQGNRMLTSVTNVRSPPTERDEGSVRSVFPNLFSVEFDPFGITFDGAYEWKDEESNKTLVYAISARAEPPLAFPLALLASRECEAQVPSLFQFLESREKGIDTADPPLDVTALLNNDPLEEQSSGEYRDVVASVAMDDFYEIIKYYLDEDLRKTFISASPIILEPQVKAIADDHPDNYVFYKKLQVPFLTAILGTSTLEEGENCNAKRAEKLLGSLPVDDPVYKRHSSALYRMRYLEKFPSTREFLADQQNKNYNSEIDRIAEVLNKKLADNSEDLKDTNPDYEEDLARAQADIVKLATWAKQKKLYWAFMVLYWVESASIPLWYSQYVGGGLSASLGRQIKKLNSLFGNVENDEVNTTEGGRSFMQAFNEAIRLFQMSSIIPQLVDLDRNSSDYDSLVKAALYEFWQKNKDSDNSEIAEQAALAKQLFENDQLRENFHSSFKYAQILAGGFANWSVLMNKWERIVENATWYKRLGNIARKMYNVIQFMASATMIALPFLTGGWSELTAAQKAEWISAVAGLAGAVGIWITERAIAIAFLFEHISSLKDVMKVIFKFDKFMKEIPGAANKISNTFAKFFGRMAKSALKIDIIDDILPTRHFSQIAKLFGRNLGEKLASVAGIVLAVTGLVFSAMELAKGGTPYEIATNIMFLLSSVIQVLSIIAGWVAAASWMPTIMSPILTFVGTFGGPIAVALAIVGVIVFIIYLFKKKPLNPVEQFIEDHVKPKGLYMEHMAIDYFDILTSDVGQLSKVGLSLRGAGVGPGEGASPSEQVYLYLSSTESTAEPRYRQDLEYTTDDVWSLQTNGDGQSQISTQKYFLDEDDNRYRTVWFLAHAENDTKKLTLVQLPSRVDEPEKYEKVVKQTYWNIDVVADPDRDPKSDQPVRALCNIKQGSKYLAIESDSGSTPKGLTIVDQSDLPKGRYVYFWMFNLDPLGPVNFSYMHNPWLLVVDNADESNSVIWDEAQATSSGLQWSISPPLDSSIFELVTTAGSDEGSIRMKEGVKAPLMEKKLYTVTCTANLPGNKTAERQAEVEIVVESGEVEDS